MYYSTLESKNSTKNRFSYIVCLHRGKHPHFFLFLFIIYSRHDHPSQLWPPLGGGKKKSIACPSAIQEAVWQS